MQGHQNWCKLSCCEQGLDWIVTLIPGKGVGIIALDDIPSLSRIIVEASREINIANSFDLMPFGGSFQEKLANNGIVGKSGKNHLYPWIARLNHSCDANASICIDDTFKVAILYAKKDIKRGQEITINYQPLNLHGNQTPEDVILLNLDSSRLI